MRELWQKFGWAASAGFVVIVFYCLWLWQPERQVRLHQKHFLDAAEKRSWGRFGKLIDAGYGDRWGHDKTFLMRESSEVLRQFFAITIRREEVRLDVANGRGEMAVALKLDGNGTPIAQYAQRAVNAINTPFVFEWRQRSWKPWDWKLVRADNPELRLGGGFDF